MKSEVMKLEEQLKDLSRKMSTARNEIALAPKVIMILKSRGFVLRAFL